MAMPSGPSGSILTANSGSLQARAFEDSVHLALAGPDSAGTPHANVITLRHRSPRSPVRPTRSAGSLPRRLCRMASGSFRTLAGPISRRGSRSRPTG